MNAGLSRDDIKLIATAIQQFPEIENAVIFGSRAKGTYRKASDVDLAVKGSAVTGKTIQQLHFLLNEELPLPYFFDVVHYEALENPLFVTHIDSVGKSLAPFAT